jgi:hypothetical protein
MVACGIDDATAMVLDRRQNGGVKLLQCSDGCNSSSPIRRL